MLIDEVTVQVIAGHGGAGRVSFRREKFVPKGGPNGGNGGKGGDIYVQGLDNIRYLKKYREVPVVKGVPGQGGGKNKRTGASGEDTIMYVPRGSRIVNRTRGTITEILDIEQKVRIARGGKGGHGNFEFRSATNQAPHTAEQGLPGERAELYITLMMIADVGLIGLPNAGKSSLLNALTHAHAPVANYPFTTLEPNLGSLHGKTIADIPGLIEGASRGKGLGTAFLKHIERTRLLLHCISCESTDPKHDYETVRQELRAFNPALMALPEIIIFTKSDLSEAPKLKNHTTLSASIVDDKALKKLRDSILKTLKNNPSSSV